MNEQTVSVSYDRMLLEFFERRNMKSAEIFRDATTKEEVVMCPYCDAVQETDVLGVISCYECERYFEVFVSEIEA